MTLTNPYIYSAKVIKVVDGDTIDCEIDLGFSIIVSHRLRLLGIDAPELKELGGHESKAYLIQTILDKNVMVMTRKHDSFGRYLAEVFLDDVSVNSTLLRMGLATRYGKE